MGPAQWDTADVEVSNDQTWDFRKDGASSITVQTIVDDYKITTCDSLYSAQFKLIGARKPCWWVAQASREVEQGTTGTLGGMAAFIGLIVAVMAFFVQTHLIIHLQYCLLFYINCF